MEIPKKVFVNGSNKHGEKKHFRITLFLKYITKHWNALFLCQFWWEFLVWAIFLCFFHLCLSGIRVGSHSSWIPSKAGNSFGGSGLFPSFSEVAPWQEAEWLLAHQLPPSLSTLHTASPPSAHLIMNLPANLHTSSSSLSTLPTSYQFTLSTLHWTPPCWLWVNSFSPSCQPCTTAAPNSSSKTDPEK